MSTKFSSLLIKFGVALPLVVSFAGFLFARSRSKAVRPSLPTPPPSRLDADNQLGWRRKIGEDVHTTSTKPISQAQDKPCKIENGSSSCSPSRSIDRDRFLLAEPNEVMKEYEVSSRHKESNEYEQEVERLNAMVAVLREREESLEMQLLEYYDMEEQETEFVELKNQVKIKDAEAQVWSLKTEALQGENRRLKAQVADHTRLVIYHRRVARELEDAKAMIKKMKTMQWSEAVEIEEQMLIMEQQEHDPDKSENAGSELGEIVILQRFRDLKNEVEELKMQISQNRQERENSDLALWLESTLIRGIEEEDPFRSKVEILEWDCSSAEVKSYEGDFISEYARIPEVKDLEYDHWSSSASCVTDRRDNLDQSHKNVFLRAATHKNDGISHLFTSFTGQDPIITTNRAKLDVGAECTKQGPHGQSENSDPNAMSNSSMTSLKEVLFLMGGGYEFQKEELAQLWMAFGLIKDEPMEINAASYFDKLVSEGYISGSDSNSMYKVTTKVKTVISQNRSKYLVLKNADQQNVEPDKIWHVSVECDSASDAISETLRKMKKLRTLLNRGTYFPKLEQLSLNCSEFLSVLDLSGADITELPGFVGEMGQLRYLDLSWTLIEHLPEALTCLKRLQTLRLRGCSLIRRLPRDMKMLTELRHLDLNILSQLEVMPKGLGALMELRTLSSFIVSSEEELDIKELEKLNNLSGEFCIARLENVKSAEDAKCASMAEKSFVKKLHLTWSDFPLRDLPNEVSSDSVLNNLRPHSTLEELMIRCYAGTSLPSWIADGSYFRMLARVSLFHCEHISVFPAIQFLPSLDYLHLVGLNSVTKVDVRGQTGHPAFPMLRALIIDEMMNVETWTEAEQGDFPCLVELNMIDCPNLSEFPSLLYLTSLKRLEMSSCPEVDFLADKRLSSSMELLVVDECPLFLQSCREHGGQEWELIKHVPNVWIDQQAILQETDTDDDVVEDDVDIGFVGLEETGIENSNLNEF